MLYDKFSAVKKYYEIAFAPDTTKIVKEYKKQLYKVYFTTKGTPGKGNSNVSRTVIYSDLNEAFYNSLTRSFDEACQLIANERLEETFKNDCERLMKDAYSIGWGVYGAMEYSYSQVM